MFYDVFPFLFNEGERFFMKKRDRLHLYFCEIKLLNASPLCRIVKRKMDGAQEMKKAQMAIKLMPRNAGSKKWDEL